MDKITCPKCQEEKNHTEEFFNKNKVGGKIYLEKTCKKCRYKRNNERRIERYYSDPEFRRRILISTEKSRQKSQANRNETWRNRMEATRRWKERNPDKVKAMNKRRNDKRWKDPTYKISKIMSNKVNSLIKDKNNSRLFDLLDYSLEDLMSHLESQFQDGMAWSNHGEWHIDHIRPVCSFNFTSKNDKEFKECWALSNLQPLWAKDNLSKGGKWPDG